MKKKINKVSVVFSFRNEENNIKELTNRVHNVVKQYDYELIFVNDDSTDKSELLLKKLLKKYPIKILNMSRRFGVAHCIIAGLKFSKGDLVIYMDSDLQDPPEIIPKLIDKYLQGNEVVHTKRTSRSGEPLTKLVLTKLAYKIINFFSEINLEENAGDFKLLSRKAVNEILKLPEYSTYIRGLSVWVGFKQDVVLYDRQPRAKGISQFPIFSQGPITEFLRGLTAFSATPLFFSLIFSVISIFLAIAISIYAVYIKLTGVSESGVPSILIALSFFNGVTLFAIGILGIYISQIYYEVKRRPKFIIKDFIESKD